MRALAEFAMKGRGQATFAAVLATGTVLFAWAGAAIVALVILRRGLSAGSFVLLWALLPAIALVAMGDTGPLTTLLGTALAASVLRVTASWPLALTTAVGSGVMTGLAVLMFGGAYVEEILRILGEFIAQLQTQAQSQGGEAPAISKPSASQILGLLGLSNAITVVLCLILARWWQAMLYNPGGFRSEFHGLRLTPPLTVLLLVSGCGLALLGPDYRFWALIFAVPFMFTGFALVHGLAGQRQLGGNWLGMFYFAWLILEPFKLLLLLLAAADSWLDIRGRSRRSD